MKAKYYTAHEVADIFKVSYRTILNEIARGNIRAFKLSESRRHPYLIPESEIDRLEVEGLRRLNPNLNTDEV